MVSSSISDIEQPGPHFLLAITFSAALDYWFPPGKITFELQGFMDRCRLGNRHDQDTVERSITQARRQLLDGQGASARIPEYLRVAGFCRAKEQERMAGRRGVDDHEPVSKDQVFTSRITVKRDPSFPLILVGLVLVAFGTTLTWCVKLQEQRR